MYTRIAFFILVSLALAIPLSAQTNTNSDGQQFTVTSSNFTNNGALPISAISNIVQNNLNICSINGAIGDNRSPELSWTNPPAETRSFVVVLYDVTAAFTHWGMYNISPNATGLPNNAGVSGSKFGMQVINDFFIGAEYDGPCPPAGVSPFIHRYVFTVYALDTGLKLPAFANFPATAETLYNALIQAGQGGHILASASITGLYSTTQQ